MVCRSSTQPEGLLKWTRESYDYHTSSNADFDLWSVSDEIRSTKRSCSICQVPLAFFSSKGATWGELPPATLNFATHDIAVRCPLCGWEFSHHIEADYYYDSFSFNILKLFDINSSDVALSELGTYLKQNPHSLYSLKPRRFEELVADVFRSHGYKTMLTSHTRDEGADIVLLHNAKKQINAVIECKRYAKDRKVGIDVIRKLIGAAVDWDVRKAYLVTTSSYTSGVHNKIFDFQGRGYEVELIAFAELIELLGIYNEDLPRLHMLSKADRQAIIATFRGKYA